MKTKSILLIISVALTAVLTSACSNKGGSKSGSSIYTYGPYNPGCPGCTGTFGNMVAGAIGQRSDLEIGLRLFGVGGASFNPLMYQGPVTAQGYMVAYSNNSCLPPGQYTIRSLAPNGHFVPDYAPYATQAFNLTNFMFEAIHQSGFVAVIQAQGVGLRDTGLLIGLDGGSYPHVLYGQFYIQTPYCGSASYFFPLPI